MKKLWAKVCFPFAWLKHTVRNGLYDLKVKLHAKTKEYNKNRREKSGKPHPDNLQKNWIRINKIRDLIYYCAWIAVPLFFFILLYVVINGNSILLAFQKTNDEGAVYFNGFNNFIDVFKDFFYKPQYGIYLSRSLIVYGVSLIFMFLPMFFSFYVYKKMAGHKIFTTILFLPTILSSMVTVSIFRMLADKVIPDILLQVFGTQVEPLITNTQSAFTTLLFYSTWMGFGSGLLTQLAAMNSIDISAREAAQLDGVTFFQEFIYIAFPATYQVIMLTFITGFAGIFTNQLNLYAFYGEGAPAEAANLGYFIQIETLKANEGKQGALHDFHYLSAYGLIITLITVPITLLMKHLIFTYGPSEDTREKKKKKA